MTDIDILERMKSVIEKREDKPLADMQALLDELSTKSARIAALEDALRGVMEDWHAQGCYALHPFTDGAECDCGADKARNAARKALGKGSE